MFGKPNIKFLFQLRKMNKNIIKIACGIALSLSLIACSEKDPMFENEYDVSYYKEHQDVLKEVLDTCKNNPGKYQDTPNCINAQRALSLASAGLL